MSAGAGERGAAADVAVIDTGICNLRSVTKALEAAGARVRVVRSPAEVGEAGGLVLPGVGALGDCVAALGSMGMGPVIREWIAADRPFLGVCLGLQALFEWSEEGGVRGLGVFGGEVRRLRLPAGYKIPHMGWNEVRFVAPVPVAEGLGEPVRQFYFVHSYHVVPADRSVVAAVTEYGIEFVSAVGVGNVVATQFHPEKSQACGLRLYANFARLAAGGGVPAAGGRPR